MASSEDIDVAIRSNITWAKLSDEMRTILGGSQREYDKRVLDYSIKNQLRYNNNIVRFVKKNQEEYYEALLNYSRSRMMLYPYHLSDILVRELRITPFTYYTEMVVDVMEAEKSYDSIPNFTAVDTMRILGIGRNQYIDLMNQNRANRRLFRRSKSVRDILPQKPTSIAPIEPWFLLCYGCVLENDIRLLNSMEKSVIDRLMDEGPILCGLLDKAVVQRLLGRGLVYLDVPVLSDDYVYVPTLDGFVMNRLQGDYFETLLYKIFVAIDGQTSIRELSETIGIPLDLVKNAISVFCRLGFVRKRVTGTESISLDGSWCDAGSTGSENHSTGLVSTPSSSTVERTTPEPGCGAASMKSAAAGAEEQLSDLSTSLGVSASCDFDEEEEDGIDIVAAVENVLKADGGSGRPAAHQQQISPLPPPSIHPQTPTGGADMPASSKRIAFLFDSTLTAFLMMGNLSASLKNHAVTLFEVGKLSDDALDNFIDELQNVNFFAEGEAQRYSEHAKTLLYTIQSLRSASECLDLIRGESLLNLETAARQRVVEKSYKLLVSMAPIGAEACSLHFSTLAHLGTSSVELCSAWFRLFLYELAGNGPTALLLPMGAQLSRLPKPFWHCPRLMLTQGTHEPTIFPVESSLIPVGEALLCAPVFLQAYSQVISDAEIVNVPFPFDNEIEATEEEEEENNMDRKQKNNNHHNGTGTTSSSPSPSNVGPLLFTQHPVVRQLRSALALDKLCGYIVLLKLHDNKKLHDNSGSSKNMKSSSAAGDNNAAAAGMEEDATTSATSSPESQKKKVVLPATENEEEDGADQEAAKVEADTKIIGTLAVDEIEGEEAAPSPSQKMMMFSNCSNFSLNNTFQFSSSITKDPKKVATNNRVQLDRGECFEDFVLFDCVFGIPLFDEALNKSICQRVLAKRLLAAESHQSTREAMRHIIESTRRFIGQFNNVQPKQQQQQSPFFPASPTEAGGQAFDSTSSSSSPMAQHPTRAVLFDPRQPDRKCTAPMSL